MKDLSKKILRINNSAFYPRDYYYDKLVSKYDNPDFFCSLLEGDKLKDCETSSEIRFNRTIGFGTSFRTIVGELGKPNLMHKKIESFSYKVLFYRFKIGGHKTKCELHLLDDKLFFFSYILSYLSKDNILELKSILASKYLGDSSMDITALKISDPKKNMMIVEESLDFTISYLSGEPGIYRTISNALKKVKNKEEVQAQVRYNELYKCF